MQIRLLLFAALCGAIASHSLLLADPPTDPLHLSVSNNVKTVTWPRALIPALATNRLRIARNPTNFIDVAPNSVAIAPGGYTYTISNAFSEEYFGLQTAQMSSNALLTASVLNRLAYGPTPDELERVIAIGPQAYIDEQLAPEAITETGDVTLIKVTTNSAPAAATTNWSSITVTGSVSSSLFYMFLTGPGDVFVDDVQLRLQTTSFMTNVTYTTNGPNIITNTTVLTNITLGTNMLINGDFESAPLNGTGTNSWRVSSNLAGSGIATNPVCSGLGSLRLVSTAAGSNQVTAVWQQLAIQPTGNNYRWVLTFRYLPNAYSGTLVARVSAGGTRASAYPLPPAPTWYYATATGTATTTPRLYIYLTDNGEAYIDDVKLVAGSVPEAGVNLLQNGDFESPLTGPWQMTQNFSNSYISTAIAHSGGGSLKIVATGGGLGSGNSIFQDSIAGVTNAQTYTVSFWYTLGGAPLVVRLSGSGTAGLLVASPDTSLPGLKRRLDNIGGVNLETGAATIDNFGGARLEDLRAWFCMNAVGSKRQLLEILDQFLENHFVTEHAKSLDYLNRYYQDFDLLNTLATDWEYREHSKWRAALMNPAVTFYDLLKTSAESPAMIVYLDTVDSRGDGGNIANENYAREIMELFCMGVDNGYEQHDIEAQSRAWTGWSIELVDRAKINNPFAPQSTAYEFYPGSGYNSISNISGAWAFNYKANNHGTNRAPIFSVWSTNSTSTNLIPLGPKIVPARFGPPWAGRGYQLVIPRRVTGDTNSIQDGYDVVRALANLPFTEEYISIKLCRLFVHDNFPNPTTKTNEPEYAFYDYTNPNRSAEAELVHQCMLAWENSNPKGRLRPVLNTIFSSDLFRSHGGSLQKVKTPLEYVVSAVRALRSANPNGTFTANTDGNFTTPLSRMGSMNLFNRDAPDGYPESGPPWISAGTLAERLRFVQTLLTATGSRTNNVNGGANNDAGNNTADPVALLKKKLPSGSWGNSGAVADYFLSILYPAEGKANLDLYRASAISFLDTADDGVTLNPFVGLSNTSAAYDTRVRGMVSWLMTLQRFQEQ